MENRTLRDLGGCASPKLCPAVKSTVCTTSSTRPSARTVPYVPLSPPLVGRNPQAFSITTRLALRKLVFSGVRDVDLVGVVRYQNVVGV
jgi:hypothetical protein